MKKTISVNIKGINFIMEEDAYQLLQNYLERLRSALGNEKIHQETLEDIEFRIAELCSAKLSESKTVIELTDIESIIKVMGEPEDYMSDDDEIPHTQEAGSEPIEKRLFRDPRRATIAGVCAGIANYLNIDVVIVRAIFVIMFITGGFGIPLYIILWVIIPKAKSSIDRLRMRGRPITVDSVKSEVENAAQNLSKGGKRVARQFAREDHYSRTISRGVRIIAQIIGIGLIAFAMILLVPFLIFIVGGFGIIPVQGEPGLLSFPEFGSLVLSNDADYQLTWIGALLSGFSLVLFLTLTGSMILFRIKNLWTKLSLFGLFLAGLTGVVILSTIGISTSKDFFFASEVENPIGASAGKELVIVPHTNAKETREGQQIIHQRGPGLLEIENDMITLYGLDIEYVVSKDSLFHVTQYLNARGNSQAASARRAKQIKHGASMLGDTLQIDTYYKFPAKNKLRDQEVHVVVEIPKDGRVIFGDHIITLGKKDTDNHLEAEDFESSGYLKWNGNYRHDD